MPRYFFDTHDSEHIRDDEGRECADFGAARLLALSTLPEIARWAAPEGGDWQMFTMSVRDEADQLVYTVSLTLDGWRLDSATVHHVERYASTVSNRTRRP